MQPKTSVRFDAAAFERLKSRVRDIAQGRRSVHRDPAYATHLPTQIGIKMNNGCNLRCKHCYEWNTEGYHRSMGLDERKDEIPLDMIEQVLAATRPTRAKIYLWGGEPLMYSQFDGFMRLLEKDPRWTTVCTNALLTEEKLDSLLRASESLAFLASVDGLEEQNDAIRGKGTFRRIVKALDLLLELQRKQIYRGSVSVSLTLNDAVVGQLFEFLEFFEGRGVDSVYLVFPWYIPPYVAQSMDRFVANQLPHLSPALPTWSKASWHSFTYHIAPENVCALKEEMVRINARVWNMRVRFHPALDASEVEDFVIGRPVPAEQKTRCMAITNRVDLLPSGDVVTCKFFPETRVGNLSSEPLEQIWHNARSIGFRQTLACGLSPVCSKCTLLYSTG
jgi:MoaA/NifB/PqqE/SkfB family radical SAM enzyme